MISINDVYTTTLTLLNKEQRGYVTPTEFNEIAGVVQNEVFEGYFQKAGVPDDMDSELSNIGQQYKEKLEPFIKLDTISNGDYTGSSIPYTGRITFEDFYRMLNIYVSFPEKPSSPSFGIFRECDRVNQMDAQKILLSPLTYPTQSNPIVVLQGESTIPGSDDTNKYFTYTITPEPLFVQVQYIRKPATPQWVGVTINGQIVPDTEKTVNFELHQSDYAEVVAKTLGYFGLQTRSDEVMQVAGGKEQQNAAI